MTAPKLADIDADLWAAIVATLAAANKTGCLYAQTVDIRRASTLAMASDAEIFNLACHLSELAPDSFREAVEIIYRLAPVERDALKDEHHVPGAPGGWFSDPCDRDRFRATHPISVAGGIRLAEALDKAGTVDALAREWRIECGSIRRRASAIVRRHPGEEQLRALAEWCLGWEVRRRPEPVAA